MKDAERAAVEPEAAPGTEDVDAELLRVLRESTARRVEMAHAEETALRQALLNAGVRWRKLARERDEAVRQAERASQEREDTEVELDESRKKNEELERRCAGLEQEKEVLAGRVRDAEQVRDAMRRRLVEAGSLVRMAEREPGSESLSLAFAQEVIRLNLERDEARESARRWEQEAMKGKEKLDWSRREIDRLQRQSQDRSGP